MVLNYIDLQMQKFATLMTATDCRTEYNLHIQRNVGAFISQRKGMVFS